MFRRGQRRCGISAIRAAEPNRRPRQEHDEDASEPCEGLR